MAERVERAGAGGAEAEGPGGAAVKGVLPTSRCCSRGGALVSGLVTAAIAASIDAARVP